MQSVRLLCALGLLLLLSPLLSSCSFSRGTLGDEFKQENIEAVKKGTSTRMDVVNALGAPDRVLQVNGQEVFQYYRYDAKVGSLLLILVNFSRLNVRSDDLYIWFNRDSVVQDLVFGRRTDKLKFQFWPFGE
jgi:outer membrane protein assembly factor BamE (lipoprotein component of BamABCDE complex)